LHTTIICSLVLICRRGCEFRETGAGFFFVFVTGESSSFSSSSSSCARWGIMSSDNALKEEEKEEEEEKVIEVYHERQCLQFCLLHALNNLLQVK
jgi:hypothetical protein